MTQKVPQTMIEQDFPVTTKTPASGVIAVDLDKDLNVTVSLTGNVTSWTLTGGKAGQYVPIRFVQDATGNRTVVFNASMKGTSTVNFDTTANGVTWLLFYVKDTSQNMECVGFRAGTGV